MPNVNDLELARIKATHARRGPSGAARLTAAARLESCAIEAERHKKNLDHIEDWLTVSAAFQQLAVEATLTAVTMGGARVISAGIIRFAGTGMVRAAEGGAGSRTALRALASRSLPSGAASSHHFVVAKAAAGTLGRLGAGLLMSGARGVISGQAKDEPGRFCSGLLAGVAGSLLRPASAVRGAIIPASMPGLCGEQSALAVRDLRRFVDRALRRAEPGALAGSITGEIDQRAFDAMIRAVLDADLHGRDLTWEVDRLTAASTQGIAEFANQQEKVIGNQASALARGFDRSREVPFLARRMSNITADLADVAADYASACARWNLWRAVLHCCHQCDIGRDQTNAWIRDTVKEGQRRVSGR
jgi:hypothetical protein